MKTCSPPIKQPDGSIVVRPLRLPPIGQDDGCRQNGRDDVSTIEDSRVFRARILRDITILAVLVTTIVAGSAVLVTAIWRDIAIADSNARIVEAEEAAKARIAEAQSRADTSRHFDRDLTFVIVTGFGLVAVVLLLARPTIIVGR